MVLRMSGDGIWLSVLPLSHPPSTYLPFSLFLCLNLCLSLFVLYGHSLVRCGKLLFC